MNTKSASEKDSTAVFDRPDWLAATTDDLKVIGDFEGPINGSNAADHHTLSNLYSEAAKLHVEMGEEGASAKRVFLMLSAVLDYIFNPENRSNPFSPMFEMAEGRSAIPDDFRGSPVEVLATAAETALNPVLRARLSDTVWLLDRWRVDQAARAVEAYLECIAQLASGALASRYQKPDEPAELSHFSCECLERALAIGRLLDKGKSPQFSQAKSMLSQLRKLALETGLRYSARKLSELDLNYCASEPQQVGEGIESFLGGWQDEERGNSETELWRLAAHAYHQVKDNTSQNRCRTAAAESLVREAEKHIGKPLEASYASHWLSDAISEYHGIPNSSARRNELKHRLVEIQDELHSEMQPFSNSIDLSEEVKILLDELQGKRFHEALYTLVTCVKSPEPEDLKREAIAQIRRHPFTSLFATTHHDREGKVRHKGNGSGFRELDGQTIQESVARSESLRRQLFANVPIGFILSFIQHECFISNTQLEAILGNSLFVPSELRVTYLIGMREFLNGGNIAALYILCPLLESSIRHVLKKHGHDVSSFDSKTQTQEDRPLSSLMRDMRNELEQIFHPSTVLDIEHVFLKKPGPTIRHSVAHGLLADGDAFGHDAVYACWLILRLCCMPLLKHWDRLDISGSNRVNQQA